MSATTDEEQVTLADLHARLDFVVAQGEMVTEQLAAREGNVSTKAMLDLLAKSKRARRAMKAVEHIVEDAAIAGMTIDGTQVLEGEDYTAVLHDGGTRKDWRTQDVTGMLVNRFGRALVKRFRHVPAKDVEAIVAEAIWNLASAARFAFRSTVLRRLDIDPNQYSRIEPNRATVELRGKGAYPSYTPDEDGDD